MAAQFKFRAIGTSWVIDIADNTEEGQAQTAMEYVMKRIDEFDKTYSRFRDDSLVAEMSRKAGEYVLPDDAMQMFETYKKLYDLTDGLVTPLMGKTLSEAGYDAAYTLKPKEHVSSAKKWEDIIDYQYPRLTIKEPAFLDFGAVGKGYIVDIVAAILEDHDIMNYTVDAGGDMFYRNQKGKALRVGLENPENTKEALGVVDLVNRSICGSSGNRRAWGEYTHIINPKTAKSPHDILAVWVVADQTLIADGLATALFFAPPEKLSGHFDFEYAIIYADRRASHSPSFPGHFFSE